MKTIVEIISFTFGLYSLILILLGTPANLLCFYVFKRLIPNRSNATIIVFSYLALVELLIPFTWNLNFATRELIYKRQRVITIKNLEQNSLFTCKFISYSAYFLLQCAAWLKTLATFARCVSLHHDWSIRKYFMKSTIIHRLSWLTIILFGLINLPILIINGKRITRIDPQTNQTRIEILCYQSKFFQFWEILHLLLYNFIPFTLMILCNISIIQHVHQSRRRTQRSKIRSQISLKPSSTTLTASRRFLSTNGSRLSKTLIFISVFFILLTSPSAIFYISLGKIIKRHRNIITMSLTNLATTCHVVSFIIYWVTSTDFQIAVYNFLCCRPIVSQRQQTQITTEEKRLSTLSTLPISRSYEKQKHTRE